MRIEKKMAVAVLVLFVMVGGTELGVAQTATGNYGVEALDNLAAQLTEGVLLTRGDAGSSTEMIQTMIDRVMTDLSLLVAQNANSLVIPFEGDSWYYRDLGSMMDLLRSALHQIEHDDIHGIHHAVKEARIKLADLRARNGVVAFGDLAWRYNCAFHPMMHEFMHSSEQGPLDADLSLVCQNAVLNAGLMLGVLEGYLKGSTDPMVSQQKDSVNAARESLKALNAKLSDAPSRVEVKQALQMVRKDFINMATLETMMLKAPILPDVSASPFSG